MLWRTGEILSSNQKNSFKGKGNNFVFSGRQNAGFLRKSTGLNQNSWMLFAKTRPGWGRPGSGFLGYYIDMLLWILVIFKMAANAA